MTPKRLVSPKKFFKCSVQYVVPYAKLHEFVAAVRPFGEFVDNRKFEVYRRDLNRAMVLRKEMRLRVVLDHVPKDEAVRMYRLYLNLKRKGLYGMTYKTFQRDVMELGLRGKIRTEVRNGGRYGNTTSIKRNK
jgi:hypothetical protein